MFLFTFGKYVYEVVDFYSWKKLISVTLFAVRINLCLILVDLRSFCCPEGEFLAHDDNDKCFRNSH